jgi:hypothetical protein
MLKQGSNFMGVRPLATIASVLMLSVAIVTLMPSTAGAWGDRQDWMSYDPSADYQSPAPSVYPFPGVSVEPTNRACCYAVPIVAVYQCPAALIGQPGSQVVYVRSNPMSSILGGQPYLYHH